MIRWTLTIVAVLLLVVWLVSGRWEAGLSVRIGQRSFTAAFSEGCLSLSRETGDWTRTSGAWINDQIDDVEPEPPRRWIPAYVVRNFSTAPWAPWGLWTLYVPLYLLAGLTATFAAFAWRRRMRQSDGPACPKCGYDLSGLTAGHATAKPICPECGT